MTLTLIFSLLAVGILLILVEIFLIPGTTIFGIIGGVMMTVAVAFAFIQEGPVIGSIALGITVVSLVFGLFGFIRIMRSGKVSLNTTVEGHVNRFEPQCSEGDEGKTITALRPGGRALINGKKIDVYSTGVYIDRDVNIVVRKIRDNKIFVQPLIS